MNCEDFENDLLTKLLSELFQELLRPHILNESSFRAQSKLSGRELIEAFESLLITCIAEYNIKLLMTHGLRELRKESNKSPSFPPIFVDYYNVRESVLIWWKNIFSLSHTELVTDCNPPEIIINSSIAEIHFSNLSKELIVQPITDFSWSTAAAFQINCKEITGKCIKWSLKNLPLSSEIIKNNDFSKNQRYKVEIALSESSSSYDPSSSKSNGPTDAKYLLGKLISKVLKTFGYSIEGDGKEFIVIPSSFSYSNLLVIVSDLENKTEKIFVEKDPVEFHSKYSGGMIILYNYARLKSILEKYECLVSSDGYPSLPSIEKVDFSIIGDSKEEIALIFLLFLWPRVLLNIVNLNRRGMDKINLSFLFDFVKTFAKAFDVFYNHVVVIVPKTTSHNFPAMIARIFLLQAISKVFKEFMDLTGMELEKLPIGKELDL